MANKPEKIIFQTKCNRTCVYYEKNQRSNFSVCIILLAGKNFTPGEWCVSNIEMINDVTMNIYERGAEVECFVNYSEATKEDTRINYELIDYYDNIVSSGSYVAKRGTESERLSLGVLDICHYTLYVYPEGSESKSHTYVSVVKPESERVYSNDSPFGLDGAFAWVVSESEAYELLRAERLAGIIYNRDRYTQKSTSPAKDEYDFDLGNSKKVFDKADELGVNIQASTVYLPEWARDADSYLTDDLLSVYKIAKEEGKAFGDSIDIYELWNEPETDIETNIYETADRFAGVSKAMALGFMDSGTNAKISTAGYTAGIVRYLDLAIRNDAAEFMDFMNFHSHITAVEGAKTNSLTSRQAVNADSTLKKYGYYNKSLSLDESGIITQFKDGHEYSRDQQKVRAGYYVTVNAQNMANGVDRHYWYIVLQRGSAMSMFTEDGNGPYPEYNAVATTTDVLGVPEYLGEVNSLKGGAKDTAPDELLSRIIVKEESSGAAYFTIQGFYMEKGVHEVLIPWDRLVFQTGADPTFMLEKDNIATFSLGINNIRKVLDVPEYTILKIGAYVGARTEDKHGTIKCEYPKNGACISNSEKLVAIGKICDDDIKVERNKIRVYVDGFPVEHIIEGDEVKADIGELEAGEHTVKFNWECEDSAAYNEEVSFVADSGDKVFSDVAEEHWAADKIANLAARGVVSGDEDGTFRPDDNVTRAEYIKMLTSVLKFKNVYDKSGFTDVSAHDWFYDYVAAASEAGLFDGVYEGEFGADTVISREDMATFTYRALKAAGITLPNTNVKQIFLDKDEISSYAKTPINMLQQAGIVEGMENRKFLPSDGLTRAEAAKVLYEVIVHIL